MRDALELKGNRTINSKRERLPKLIVWSSAILVSAVFFLILSSIVRHGIGQISWEFITSAPENAGRAGGIGPILISTGLILAVAIAAALPIGLGTAILLSEFTPRDSIFGRLVRRSLDILAGVPSIVFGLFGFVFFSNILGLGFSILSGGLTLACMVLPILIRSTEEGFRSAPEEYRISAASVGLSKTTTIFRILLPAAAPGLTVGLILGTGRAIAETAALLYTSGYVDRMPTSLLDSGRALSIHIFDLSMNVAGGNEKAYASALVLVSILAVINIVSFYISHNWLRRRITII